MIVPLLESLPSEKKKLRPGGDWKANARGEIRTEKRKLNLLINSTSAPFLRVDPPVPNDTHCSIRCTQPVVCGDNFTFKRMHRATVMKRRVSLLKTLKTFEKFRVLGFVAVVSPVSQPDRFGTGEPSSPSSAVCSSSPTARSSPTVYDRPLIRVWFYRLCPRCLATMVWVRPATVVQWHPSQAA